MNIRYLQFEFCQTWRSESRGCPFCFCSESLRFCRYAMLSALHMARQADRSILVVPSRNHCRSSDFQASRLAAELEKKAMPAFSVLHRRGSDRCQLCPRFNGQVHQTFKQSNEDSWLKKAAREASAFSLQVAHGNQTFFFKMRFSFCPGRFDVGRGRRHT